MGSSGMGDKLAKFVKDHYPDTKSDMSTVMMERCLTMCNDDGLILKARNPKSIAVRYEEIISLKQKEVRDLIAGMEVIYIYHDRVDASSHGNEADVFTACDTAIRELHGLVKKITGDMNGTHILITADHGFLYTHDPLSETDKVGKATFTDQSIEYGRRYAILKEGAEPEYLMHVRMSEEGSGYEGFAPRESIRIKMPGAGLNFVHGGASLQEMVVPVISYQHLRNDSKEYQRNKAKYDTKPVTISLLSASHQMDELVAQDCQFIISTHSPMLLCFPDAEVYQITKNGIDSVRFQDTDHYRTTVRFLQNPESAVADILGYETER